MPRIGVGATLNDPPVCVHIWFDSVLDSAFSTIIVQKTKGNKVNKGDSPVNHTDPKLLEVRLPTLPPGAYPVIWGAISRDGHRTTLDYIYAIE
jgi:methionine-rich copper-binding protein CopC